MFVGALFLKMTIVTLGTFLNLVVMFGYSLKAGRSAYL